MPVSEKPVGDTNDAAAVPVEGGDQPALQHDPEAASTGGAKMIRCRFNDVFKVDDKTTVTGAWTEYSASAAKAIIEAAARNNVRLNVANKKG